MVYSVYFVAAGRNDDRVKIYVARAPRGPVILHTIPCDSRRHAESVENELHSKYADVYADGWFAMTEQEAAAAYNDKRIDVMSAKIAQLQASIDSLIGQNESSNCVQNDSSEDELKDTYRAAVAVVDSNYRDAKRWVRLFPRGANESEDAYYERYAVSHNSQLSGHEFAACTR